MTSETGVNDIIPSYEECLSFLKEAGCSARVIEHCRAVHDLSMKYAASIPNANQNLVEAGSVLHDIGRSVTHNLSHAQAGAKICRKLGLPESLVLIVERHIGGGMPASECKEYESLGLVAKDCVPVSIEEKIVAHCDNLVKGIDVISIEDRLRLAAESGLNSAACQRIKSLSDEIESIRLKN